MISSKDISVVVQGAIDKEYTTMCLASIRKYLPDAEIILSTWDGADIKELDYDKIVLNKDPKAIVFDFNLNKKNNINRIILSSKSGVNVAQRKYILRMRTDMVMKNNNILKFTDTYPCRNPEDSLFQNRLFAYELFSIKFEELQGKTYQSLFHISDWCIFGLTQDVKELYNIQTVQEPWFSLYFIYNKEEYNTDLDIWAERKWKMSPEQYITSENARKLFPDMSFKHRLDINDEIIDICNRFIVNNFIIKSCNEWGIYNKKSLYSGERIKDSLICRNGAWLGINYELDYKKYCDKKHEIPIKYTWKDDLKLTKYLSKLKKHFNRFMVPFNIIGNSIAGFLGVIFYILHIIFNSLIFLPILLHKIFKLLAHKGGLND